MAKKDDLVPVTSEDVAQAWKDVETAKKAAEELRARFVNGDDSVTQAEIASQAGVVEWLELVAHRTENQRERYEIAYAIQARKDLKAEVLRDSAESGEELLKLMDVLYAAACEFEVRAEAEDTRLWKWADRARTLGVPDRGLISAAHEGLGIEAGGALLVDDLRIQKIDAKNVLRLLFNAIENGILPNRNEGYVSSARSIVANHGKAAV
jgi:hypothetical protein